jgi:transcriptional regulator with XRE-family HTH domain
MTRTWKDYLGLILEDAQRKKELAQALSVAPYTLERWVSGESRPRLSNIRALLEALPAPQAEELRCLAVPDFPEGALASRSPDEYDELAVVKDISTTLYRLCLRAMREQAPDLREWGICKLCLDAALRELDPQREGLELVVIKCASAPLEPGQISSLQEKYCLNERQTVHQALPGLFLGAESLAGQVVSTAIPLVLDQDPFPFCTHQMPQEQIKSAAAFPLCRNGKVAGCLVAVSATPHFFTRARCLLLEAFSDLMMLAFQDHEFYPLSAIALHWLPSTQAQLSALSVFQERVQEVLYQAREQQAPLERSVAEQMVLAELDLARKEGTEREAHDCQE